MMTYLHTYNHTYINTYIYNKQFYLIQRHTYKHPFTLIAVNRKQHLKQETNKYESEVREKENNTKNMTINEPLS